MELSHRLAALSAQMRAALAIMLVFVSGTVYLVAFPPLGIEPVQEFAAEQFVRVAIQLAGVTAVGMLVAWHVRREQQLADFARRLRSAYSDSKAVRRRLRYKGASTELEMAALDEAQLELEALKDEVKDWSKGGRVAASYIEKMEEYLHDVADSGRQQESSEFKSFHEKFKKGSRFDTDLRRAYRDARSALLGLPPTRHSRDGRGATE